MPASSPSTRPPAASAGFFATAWTWLWRLAVFAALLGIVAWFSWSAVFGPVVAVTPVKRQDVVQTVVSSGLVQTPFRMNVGSKVLGTVADIPVAEGQSVKAGDLLIQLEDTAAREAVANAEAGLAQAEARLRQLHQVTAPAAAEAQAQAEATLNLAKASYERALELEHRGIGTTAALDDARRALSVAESQLRATTLQVTTSNPGGMDVLVAESAADQARAQLRAARASLADTRIRAARDGVLITRNVERGDTVQPGAALMVLAPAGRTEIIVQIDEQNLGLIALGQKAVISADAYPQKTFEAAVSYINPSVDSTRGSLQIKLAVPEPPAYLRQDMTVTAEIETARRAKALVVDTGSIHDMASRAPWVMVVEDGRAHRRDIRVGVTGDTAVEVLDGLQPGDRVVGSVTTHLDEGERVRTASDE